MVGALFHVIYLFVFSVFINEVYVYRLFLHREILFGLMGISLVYPTIYDFTQLKKQGFTEYFSDIWNYFDQCHIWIGYGNIVIQALNQDFPEIDAAGAFVYRENTIGFLHVAYTPNPNFYATKKIIIIIVTAVMLLKTFFFLRRFESLSHLVLLLRHGLPHDETARSYICLDG